MRPNTHIRDKMSETREAITRLEAALERIATAQQTQVQELALRLDAVIAQLREALEE